MKPRPDSNAPLPVFLRCETEQPSEAAVPTLGLLFLDITSLSHSPTPNVINLSPVLMSHAPSTSGWLGFLFPKHTAPSGVCPGWLLSL